MADKKNRGRFTLQFNPVDPQQSKAADILEQHGRHKAQFLTNAILHYIHCPETPDASQPVYIDNAELEKRVMEILRRHSEQGVEHKSDKEGRPAAEIAPAEQSESMEEERSFDSMFGPELSSAIANTLAAFYRE